MNNTDESLKLTQYISENINNQTFHHHYHVLYDIAKTYPDDQILNYVEIGCYAGGSACLLLQRPNTNVISIDLGRPISPNVVLNNVDKLNIHKNFYVYLLGNSQTITMVSQLKNKISEIDILFIDGDHSYKGVKNDFNLYSSLVKHGGYIVFDDYNDDKHSPEVKKFVNELISLITDEYEIIGTLPNIHGARPSELNDGNCFIIKKKHSVNIHESYLNKISDKEKIAIVIPTYWRKDGSTINYLERSLSSIKKQSYQNYKVFLIGDRYENDNEFETIAKSILPSDKIYYENLTFAEERDVYGDNKIALWSYGGVNANNHGIEVALKDGFRYVSHLDHDDYWEYNHLSSIIDVIHNTSSPFICTKSKYFTHGVLPRVTSNKKYIEFYPSCAQLIHSSTCIDFKKIPLRYEDVYKNTGKVGQPSDCILWNNINKWLKENNTIGYLINEITCIHDEEGYTRKNR